MNPYRCFVDYLFHSLTSKTRHGVHSPFVYRLVDEVIYDYSSRAYELEIEALQSSLKKDRRIIKVNDWGTNSVQSKSKEKEGLALAGYALRPTRVAKLIARLAVFSCPSTIVEVGTYSGVTAAFLAKAMPSSHVVTIAGCHETARVAKGNFMALDLNNIELKIGNVDSLLIHTLEELESLDFLLINENQSKELALNYFNACLSKVHERTLFIFDGIYQNPGMKELWNDIKLDPRVTVTVDLFHIGLVFFKGDQKKENFKIRFL